MRKLGLLLVVVLCGVGPQAAHAATGDWYLALGDSVAAGVMSGPTVTGGGYADQLLTRLRTLDHGLQLENIAEAGASTSALGGQLINAESFLKAHAGHVPFVTIDIGGNDVAGCPPTDQACFTAGLAAIDRNVPPFVAGLTAAAGPETRFAMMTYYDPFLVYGISGSGGSAAQASVLNVQALNAHLVTDFGAGFRVADVARAFSTFDTSDTVSTQDFGSIPMNVAAICQLDSACSQGFDVHPNSRGHRLIAETFFTAFTGRPSPPSSLSPPRIAGRVGPGDPLTVTHGVWANSPTAFTYQWQRCRGGGSACSSIPGATRSTFTVRAIDGGRTLRVKETATNADGRSAPQPSAVTSVVPGRFIPTASEISTLLATQIAPRGRRGRIPAILKAGGYSMSVRTLTSGVTQLAWYDGPLRTTRRLVALGRLTSTRAGTRTLKLKLTTPGRRRLAHARRLTLTGRAMFTPSGGHSIAVIRAFVLNR